MISSRALYLLHIFVITGCHGMSENNLDDCGLDVTATCLVRGDGMPEQNCERFVLPQLTIGRCEHTPLTTTMLYNGGDCSQSDNEKSLDFVCRDGDAVPSSRDGDAAFIVATDSLETNVIYHQGWVEVGEEYVLGDGTPMKEGFLIRIYDSEERENMLQEVSYRSNLCSSPDELLNRFGASQITSYTNEPQGIISPFASFSYKANLSISVVSKQGVTLNFLHILTSFAGLVDLSKEVSGHELTPNSSLELGVPLQIDLSRTTTHSLLSYISASRTKRGFKPCSKVDFHKFRPGSQLVDVSKLTVFA